MIERNAEVENVYVGNGTTAEFPITFKVWTATDLKIFIANNDTGVETTLTQDADFILGEKFEGITLISAGQAWVNEDAQLLDGFTLFIQFNPEAYQPAKFTDLGRTAPMKFEGALDRLAMAIKATLAVASRALSFSGGAGADSELPSLIGNAGKILKVNDTEDGIDYGIDAQTILDARDQANTAAGAATTAAGAAATSAGEASTSAGISANAATAAGTSASEADAAKTAAEEAAENAETLEAEAERWAHYYAFDKVTVITFADSPYTINYITDENALLFVDTTDGEVAINLPNLTGMPNPTWKVGVAKRSTDTNDIVVTPFGAQTVNTNASLTITANDVGVVFHDASPTNWDGDYVIMGSFGSTGGGFIPEDYAYQGFSARFNETFDSSDLADTLSKILVLSYLGPQVSLSASGSSTVREKGTEVTASTLTASVTKRSDPISRIQFFLNNVAISGADYNPPGNTGSGSQAHSWNGSFTDTPATFKVEVTDDGTSGGPTTVSASTSFTFVYPYYFGAAAPGISAAAVGALTKDVRVSNATLTKSYTTTSGQVYYFAYPASYGALTSILDINGFDTFLSWTLRTQTITGLDGSAVSYRIYEFNLPQGAGSMDFTFIR